MSKCSQIISIMVFFVLLLSICAFSPVGHVFSIAEPAEVELTSVPVLDDDEHEHPACRGANTPRVDKPTGNGPYSTTYVFDYIPRVNDTGVPARVYFPTSGGGEVSTNGAPFNGIVFAPGAGGTETSYSTTLSTIASWGFIVTIVGTGGPCNQEVVDIQSYVLDYYAELNANSSSIFYNKINTTASGASGHSNGGWSAIAGAVADTRFQAVCTLAAAAGPSYDMGQANTANLHVPLQLVAGAEDYTFLPSSNAYYSLANPIVSYIKIDGSGHGGPFNLEYLVSFFKVWLNGKYEYSTFVYGDELQKDIDDLEIEFDSDLGLYSDPTVSKTSAYEDELISLTAGGLITSPNPPERTIALYQWDFDMDGNYDWESAETGSTTISYAFEGEYSILFKITDSWGLSAREDYSIYVQNKRPTADAGDDFSAVEDEIVYFDAGNSSDTASDIDNLTFQWDFDDKNWTYWDSSPAASHAFTRSGKYDVKVSVKDDDGVIAIDIITVTVNNLPPSANCSANKTVVRIDELITFDASMTWDTPSDKSNLDYLWDFGDSDLAEGNYTEHAYSDEGEYLVTLSVEDNDGETSTDSLKITVLNSRPRCEAMDDVEADEDEIITFTGSGWDTSDDQQNLSYSWNFDIPGVPDSAWNDTPKLEFIYPRSGVYIAVLTVRDDDGATDSDFVTITVLNVEPTAKFTPSPGIAMEDETVNFDASASTDTSSDLKFLNYSWDFDDSSPVRYGVKPSHTFTEKGEYEVTLTVTDDNGAQNVYSKKITVENVKPSVKISASNTTVDLGTEITFTATDIYDSPSDLASLAFTWNFGDVATDHGEVVTYTFTDPGRQWVTLTVTDDDGASGSAEITIRVNDVEEEDDVKTVSEETDDWSLVIISVVVVIIIVMLLLFIFIFQRRKRTRADTTAPGPMSMPYDQGPPPQDVYMDYGQQQPPIPPAPPMQPQMQMPLPLEGQWQVPPQGMPPQSYEYIPPPGQPGQQSQKQIPQQEPFVGPQYGPQQMPQPGYDYLTPEQLQQQEIAPPQQLSQPPQQAPLLPAPAGQDDQQTPPQAPQTPELPNIQPQEQESMPGPQQGPQKQTSIAHNQQQDDHVE